MTGTSLLPALLFLLAFLLAFLLVVVLPPLPPALVLLAGGALLPCARPQFRAALLLGLPLLALALLWRLPEGVLFSLSFLDYTLQPVKVSPTGRLFATVFAGAAFLGGLYGLRQARSVELAAALVYAGSAIGVTLAGDLLTLFVFWELLALASTLVIWSAGTPASYRASMRYLLIHLLGGIILMAGIAARVVTTGSVAFPAMHLDSLGNWLILIGFLVNAGAPPLSAWIADAYPEASPSGMVFLAAFTTKTAVYVLLTGFAGAAVLIPLGLYMAFYGIFYALLENDMRRLLAYTIVSPVGVMLTAIGIGTPLALDGVVAYACSHILYKALLLMAAGGVVHATGRHKFTELGGLYRSMPLTALFAVLGMLSIAFPFTVGFVSKALLGQAVLEADRATLWLLLLAAAVGVFLAGLRFVWLVFFHRNARLQCADLPRTMRIAMGLTALLCIAPGCYPGLLYAWLPLAVTYQPYTVEHVVTQLQLLLFTTLAFLLLRRQLKPTPTINLDCDWFYRRFGRMLAREFVFTGSRWRTRLENAGQKQFQVILRWLFIHHGPKGALARTWPTGSMVLWVAVLLGACLIFYYL